MAEFPALPLFTDAYLADTRHLTTEEHGAYLLLLMCAWRTRGCALKDDDRMLARMAGVSRARWRKLRPLLAEFFSIEEGVWRQKKLSQVYETVAKKVERNRQNGAKGGRAKAARKEQSQSQYKALKNKDNTPALASFSPGWSHLSGEQKASNTPPPKALATKTKAESKSSSVKSSGAKSSGAKSSGERESLEEDAAIKPALEEIAAAAGVPGGQGDTATVAHWLAAGVKPAQDALPVIRHIRKREEHRTGRAPQHLAYYGAAVLEARDKRLKAVAAGRQYAQDRPAAAPKKMFHHQKAADWRQFLGEAKSRFRGNFLSENWQIKADHPFFQMADLGPDPRHRFNPRIPREIYEEYGPAWGWCMPPDGS